MSTMANRTELLENARRPFNILEEFSALSPKRKILLCDHLFVNGRPVFAKTVNLLWPEAVDADIKKLEGFLSALKKRAH